MRVDFGRICLVNQIGGLIYGSPKVGKAGFDHGLSLGDRAQDLRAKPSGPGGESRSLCVPVALTRE